MSEQPNALRLADMLVKWNDEATLLDRNAAAELRRLHALNTEMQLALRRAVLALASFNSMFNDCAKAEYEIVSAAIAKATGI